MSKFSINLLTYNGLKFLPQCIESVLNQSYQDFDLLIVDNASNDGTKEYLSQMQNSERIQVIFNEKNVGFAAGHNQAIQESESEYVLCLNQDVVLGKDFLKNAVGVLDGDGEVGVLQPKLLRLKLEDDEFQKTDIVDTTGLKMLKNRRIINRGQGERLSNVKCQMSSVILGADGAAPIYRRKALEDVKLPQVVRHSEFISESQKQSTEILKQVQDDDQRYRFEYFDEDFFIYKEDVDLAWRLRLYGWKTSYVPEMVGWHARGAGDSAKTSYWDVMQERRKISQFSKFYSFKNQRLMQIKNESLWILFLHIPWWLPKEIASWVYVLVFEHYTIRSIKDLIKQMPAMFRKRKIIMKNKKVGVGEMRKWF